MNQPNTAYISPSVQNRNRIAGLLRSRNIAIVAIPTQAAMGITEFEGPEFAHICGSIDRIYGPPYISETIEQEKNFPTSARHAIYTRCLENVWMCPTDLQLPERNRLRQLVQWMGGEFSGDMVEGTTHIVCGSAGSKKYRVAVETGKLIVLPDWVNKCWEAKERVNEELYKVPTFINCEIVTTGLDLKMASIIKDLTVKHGGKFNANLKRQTATHLIALGRSGAKYMKAVEWKVHIVGADWFFRSVLSTGRVDETKYPPCPISVWPYPGIDMTAYDELKPKSSITMSSLEFESEKSPFLAVGMAQRNKGKGRMHAPACPDSDSGSQELGLGNADGMDDIPGAGAGDDGLEDASRRYLDGCRIFLFQFDPNLQKKYGQALASAGGSRLPELTQSVTHVVVPRSGYHVNEISVSNGAPIVTAMWLEECIRLQTCLPTEHFIATASTKRKVANATNQQAQVQVQVQPKARDRDRDRSMVKESDDQEILSIMNKRRRMEGSGSGVGSSHQQKNGGGGSRGHSTLNLDYGAGPGPGDHGSVVSASVIGATAHRHRPSIKTPSMTPALIGNAPSVISTYSSATGVSGVGHIVIAFSTDLVPRTRTKLENMVRSSGIGDVVDGMKEMFSNSDRDDDSLTHLTQPRRQGTYYYVVDHGSSPDTWHNARPWHSKKGKAPCVVSPNWIEASCAAGYPVHPRSRSILFAPLPYPLPFVASSPLVFCTSGFYHEAKTDIERLIKAMGFDCTDTFSRRNTHLICRFAEGEKYKRAKKWKVVVGNCEWLRECVLKGEIIEVNSDLFIPPPSSLRGEDDADADAAGLAAAGLSWPSPRVMASYYPGLDGSSSRRRERQDVGSTVNNRPVAMETESKADLPVAMEDAGPELAEDMKQLEEMDQNQNRNQNTTGGMSMSAFNPIKRSALLDQDRAHEHDYEHDGPKTGIGISQMYSEGDGDGALTYADPNEAIRDAVVKKMPPKSFAFSGIFSADQHRASSVIEKLGGVITTDIDRSTRLIAGQVLPSQKVLNAISCGSWVLTPAYIDALQQHSWPDEAEFEWNLADVASRSHSLDPGQVSTMKTVVQGARFWRRKLEGENRNDDGDGDGDGTRVGAFASWRVLLCAGSKKREGFRQLLCAGGAAVIDHEPPFDTIISRNRKAKPMFVLVGSDLSNADLRACEEARARDLADYEWHAQSTMDSNRNRDPPVRWITADYMAKCLCSASPPMSQKDLDAQPIPPKLSKTVQTTIPQCDCPKSR